MPGPARTSLSRRPHRRRTTAAGSGATTAWPFTSPATATATSESSYRHELGTDVWHCLTTNIDWDVAEVAAEPRTGGVAFIVNEGGISRLFFADARGNARKLVTGLPTGIISGLTFCRTNATLGLTVNSAGSPSDAYTVSYPDGRLTRWTHSEIGGLNSDGFVSPERFLLRCWEKVVAVL